MESELKPIPAAAGLDFTASSPTFRGAPLAIYAASRKSLYKAVLREVTRDPDEENIIAQIEDAEAAGQTAPPELMQRLFRRNVTWPTNALLLVWILSLSRADLGRYAANIGLAWDDFIAWADALPADALGEAEQIAARIFKDESRVDVVPQPRADAAPSPKA